MTTAPNIEMIASSLRHCSLHGGGGRRRRHGEGEDGDANANVTVELNSHIPLPYHWEQCLDMRTGQVYYINWEDGTRTTVDPRSPESFFSSAPRSPVPRLPYALLTPRPMSSASRRSRCVSTPSSGYTSVSSVGTDVTSWAHVGAATDMDDSGYDNDNEDDDDDDEEDDDEDEESSSSITSSCSSSSHGSVVSSARSSSFSPTDSSATSGYSGSAVSTVSDDAAGYGHVLVAAGCRACFMYFMVPKSADVCPKCGSEGLIHLNRDGYA